MHAQYWTKQHFTVENGLPDNYVFAFEKFQEEIYVATDGGLVTFDGIQFKIRHKKEIRYPVSLLNKNDETLYIGSWLDGILSKENDTLKNVYSSRINRILKYKNKCLIYNTYQRFALLSFNAANQIDTIINWGKVNKNRRIAIDTSFIYISEGKTVSAYNWKGTKKDTFQYETTSTIEAINSIEDFLFFGDREGNLTWSPKNDLSKKNIHKFEKPYTITWIAPYKKQEILVQLKHRAEYNSIYKITFDESYSKITNIETLLTIKNGISDIFVDQETIYIATYGNGFYKLFPSFIKSYQKSDYQIPIAKFSYENDAGNMVFATENVSYTLQEKDTFVQEKNPFRLNKIFEFDDKRYFSSHDNLYDESLKKITASRVDNIIFAEKNDTIFHSKYWFSRYHNGARENIFCIQYSAQDKKINTGIYFNNFIYIGTQNGVKKFMKNDVDIWERVPDTTLQNFFSQKVIKNIIQHKNKLVIATPYEVFTYDQKEIEPLLFTEDDIYINATFIDTQHRIYIGTNKGFWVLTDSYTFHFNSKNGTNSDNIYSFYQDKKGTIWSVSGNGIMEFNPNLMDVTLPPRIEIYKKHIQNDYVQIHFKSFVDHFPEAVLFEYKINDADWKKLQFTQLEMSNLKPGNYSVSFRGKHMNSNWSIPETFQFKIQPKWYQITIIKVFIFIVIVCMLLGFLWNRLRVIKRRNELLSNEINQRIFLEHKVAHLREEIARDFHDEIGNKIASVIALSNNLKLSKKVASPKIDKISSLSKEIYHTAKDFVWSLNPKNNNIESLCKYLRDYGENFFDLFDEIDFLYQEIDITPIDISYVKSRNIILAYKEILANIIKHSHATKVVFKANLDNYLFTIQIQDNGIGIDKITATNGNGLKNIQKRMEMIHAEMNIEKLAGVFYTFTLNLKEELYNTDEL